MSEKTGPTLIVDPAQSPNIGRYMDDEMKHMAMGFRDAIADVRKRFPETRSDLALLASAIVYACHVELGEAGPRALAMTRTLQQIAGGTHGDAR